MSQHKVYLNWKNEGEDFSYKTYDRTHLLKFGGGTLIKASAAPSYLGNAELVNPEEVFAASLASCHLLTFLAIASMKKYTVATYEDNAVAILGKNEKLKMAVTTVYLRPNISFKGDNIPDNTTIDEMHHHAHRECFISNSVLTEIIVEPVY
jgi:organic hydroperoxide reductase OsmC/OhrA